MGVAAGREGDAQDSSSSSGKKRRPGGTVPAIVCGVARPGATAERAQPITSRTRGADPPHQCEPSAARGAGEIRRDRVRCLWADAEFDGGAATLVLPPEVCASLDLAVKGTRRVRYADGHLANLGWTAEVLLELRGRRLLCDGLVDPSRTRPLVGGAALEALEMLPDPVSLRAAVALAPPLPQRPPVRERRRIVLLLRFLVQHWSFLDRMPMRWGHQTSGGTPSRARVRTGWSPVSAHRRRHVNDIDQTIERVESLYRSLTGKEPPPNGGLGIPPEKDPMQHVTEQVERLLGVLTVAPSARSSPSASPPLSVWESPTEILICVEMPGVARESVRLAVAGGMLSVAASPPGTEDGFSLRVCERPCAEFARVIALPSGVTEQDLRAQMRDGILEIRLTKRETNAAITRPIPIA